MASRKPGALSAHEEPFPLHLLLENAESLIDVVISDQYLQTIHLAGNKKGAGCPTPSQMP